MNINNSRYNKVAIILHWLIGFAILGMFALGWYMADLPKETPDRAFFFNLHKSIGVTIFVLVAFRIYWRITHQPPAMLASMTAKEKKIAAAGHHMLYLLMVAMPVTGLIMSSYSKYGVKWFGIQVLAGVDNKPSREIFEQVHEIVGYVLLAVIILHVLAALKHHFIDKDETMKRMSLR